MNLKKVGRFLRWACVTGGMMFLGYYGHEYPSKWAWNIYVFMFWLAVVLTFFIAVAKDLQKSITDRGRSAPAWLDLMTDITQVLVLAAWGHFWMAGFWTFHTMVYNSVFERAKTEKKEEGKCAEQPQSQQQQ